MEKKNALEWSVFYIGLVVVLGLLGYLTYQSLAFEASPPDIDVAYRHEPSTNAPYRLLSLMFRFYLGNHRERAGSL